MDLPFNERNLLKIYKERVRNFSSGECKEKYRKALKAVYGKKMGGRPKGNE